MQAFIVVILAICVGLGTANPQFRPSAQVLQTESLAGFYKSPEIQTAAKQQDVAFASIFQDDEPVEVQIEDEFVEEDELVEEEISPPLAVVDQPGVSNIHTETQIFGIFAIEKTRPNHSQTSKESLFAKFPAIFDKFNIDRPQQSQFNQVRHNKEMLEDIDNAIDTDEDDDDEHILSPADVPGMSYADTPEKLAAMGIDARLVDTDLLEQAFLLVPDLIRRHGYPCDVHTVRTTDGYILEMHRIPYSPRHKHVGKRTPVFLMHGLLDSSSTWIIMGPNNGLAFLLADLGYDVWMGNARGNRYSRKHISVNPDGRRSERRRFWEFSWHQIGITDLPNMIDYVLAKTNSKRLHYIGHSQGTTSFFVLASQRPEYNDKVIAVQALAPVAFMSNLRSPLIRLASTFLNTLDATTSVLGVYEFLPNNDLIGLGAQAACNDDSFTQGACSNLLFLLAGYSPNQLNNTMIPVIAGHAPAGASVNQLVHYGQGVRSGRFRQFDHGSVSNLLTYGSIRPPAYNLRNVRAPVALHYSVNDWMAAVVDVHELSRGLGNVIGMFLVPDLEFNHLDFVWGIDVERLLYRRVFNLMRLAEKGDLVW